jgi:hypothetical protein
MGNILFSLSNLKALMNAISSYVTLRLFWDDLKSKLILITDIYGGTEMTSVYFIYFMRTRYYAVYTRQLGLVHEILCRAHDILCRANKLLSRYYIPM